MKEAFIIMQIGNPDLDKMCKEAMVPALEACGLSAKRVDKHNEGGLLKSEIISFLENAEIIVADLTNERPNCYLEVGYAMGLDKYKNLILSARDDHDQDSTKFEKGGPKVHFDLKGYEVQYWNPENLDKFKEDLEKLVRRRLAILSPAVRKKSLWSEERLDHHREVAQEGHKKAGQSIFMEVRVSLAGEPLTSSQTELLEAADKAQIHTFGWPIGLVMHNVEEFRPKPKADGIVAEVTPLDRSSYDYWAISKSGEYFLFKSVFEVTRRENVLFYDTRILRTAETLLFILRLYINLGVLPSNAVNIGIRYGGLNQLQMAGAVRLFPDIKVCHENEIDMTIQVTLSELEGNLTKFVKELTAPLFALFNFLEFPDVVYEKIVDEFISNLTQRS